MGGTDSFDQQADRFAEKLLCPRVAAANPVKVPEIPISQGNQRMLFADRPLQGLHRRAKMLFGFVVPAGVPIHAGELGMGRS